MLNQRSKSEYKAYLEGIRAGLEMAAKRLETANDETSRICIINNLREMADLAVPLAAE